MGGQIPVHGIRHTRQVLLLCAAVLTLTAELARAQVTPVEARIANASGPALLISSKQARSDAQRGDVLQPGEVIDTRGGGHVTIELSDGSLVVVGPGSRILLKDFHTANTFRELFEVLLGRVRVKIDYFGGRPNPYRINTPTASIAVRGTEFSVDVDTRRETRVIVSNGLVEVASLVDPENMVLVFPGHAVIVRPNQSIYFFVPSPVGEIGGLGGGLDFEENSRILGADISIDLDDQLNVDSPLNSARMYDRLEENLVSAQEGPLFLRFNAYPDSFLDGLQNPAYATEFSVPEGRVFLLPSFRGSQGLGANQTDFLPSINYHLSPQVSFFTPLPDHRTAIGIGMGIFRSGAGSLALANATLSGSSFPPGTVGTEASSVSTNTSFLSSSLVVAHAFGGERNTSLGLGLDIVDGWESIWNSLKQQDSKGKVARENTDSRSNLAQRRIKVGLTHDFYGDRKLGIYYSYGFVSDSFGNLSHSLDGQPQSLDSTHSAGHSSEVGVRFRGGLTRRLFYGAQTSWFSQTIGERLNLSGSVKSHERDRSVGSSFAIGLGYSIRPRIVCTFDLAGGFINSVTTRTEDATGNLLEHSKRSSPFFSAHEAVQAEISKRLFASASLLMVHQTVSSDLTLYPDSFGQLLTADGVFAPNGSMGEQDMNRYSEFGVGWHFTKSLLSEYVFSTSYGDVKSSHLVLIRYNIHLPEH